MATRTDATLFPDTSLDANFRAWVQFVEDTLVTTGGWAVTADTGQMTISTAAHPTASNQKVGYRIYKMQDTLQSTAPIFLKLYYGSGSVVNLCGIWVTIGTGSDGAGLITGPMYKGEVNTNADIRNANSSTTQANNIYGIASTNRASIALFAQAVNQQYTMAFCIERTVNGSGAATSEGVIVCWGSGAAEFNRSGYLTAADGMVQPPLELGCPHVLSGQNPSAFGGNVGLGVVVPIRGIAKQPGYNLVAYKTSDFTGESTFTLSLYGSNITFLAVRYGMQHPGASGTISSTASAIRYD